MDIVVKDLIKKYGSQKAVDGISFEVKAGEILGFLGPNGAGKTTTMKAITSYLAPTSGSIYLGKYSVIDEPEKIKKYIGYLPETNPLYADMSVIDYLKFCAEIQGVNRNEVQSRIREMVHTCGLVVEKHKKIGELSKGYRQRVGLAQALIHDPQILILDEPTTGLDPNQIVEIRELIKKLGREKTVILSSHILAEVEATCDRIMIISKGKIVADGTAEELRKKSTGREALKVSIEDGDRNLIYNHIKSLNTVYLVEFCDNKNGSFEIQSNPGMSSKREIFNLCIENKWVLTEMAPLETKLEDVFRELTLN
jgi:ABC-2 type transport system ATP-binding protein